MNCPGLEETSALFDGALSGAAAVRVREHIMNCAECTAFESDAARLRGAIRELTVVPVDTPRVSLWRRRVAIPVPLLANLVVILVLLGVLAVARSLAPSSRPAASRGVFDGLDAGRPPVVYVKARGAAQ